MCQAVYWHCTDIIHSVLCLILKKIKTHASYFYRWELWDSVRLNNSSVITARKIKLRFEPRAVNFQIPFSS